MIDTYHLRLPDPASQVGDTLIEVIASALILGVIVVGTLTGLNSANRETSLDRARSQADALAQQEEDQLRSEPVAKLSELSSTHEVVEHEVDASGTNYTITSTAQYISDTTATSSCNSTTPQADYIETTSRVTWPWIGAGKPVVETSIISPPPDSAVIVRVTNASGEAVPGMAVTAAGPSNVSDETSADGCAILGVLPGEYSLNVSKAGYVDQNGFLNSHEDPISNAPFYVVAENTVKVPYEFAQAGALAVSYQNASTKEAAVGDSFVAANNGMNPALRTFPGTVGTYTATTTSPTTVFPFTNTYSVYAGTCEADNPHVVNAANAEPSTVLVPPGKTAAATVGLPPVNIQVMSGTAAGSTHEGTPVVGAPGVIVDKGCSNTTRSFLTGAGGVLPHPDLPYGKYLLCIEATGKKWEEEFQNNTPAGPTPENWTEDGLSASKAAIIYLGTSPSGSPSHTSSGTCP
jgi:Tfp pilus assembly protein PilV